MDDGSSLLSLLDDLDEHIDSLSDVLSPLLSAPLPSTTEKLPVLDRARLYTLLVYSIESLLFSSLRLSNTNPQSHPVFAELARVKKYFAKISAAEAGPTKPRENLSVNKEAAARVIKHALSGTIPPLPSAKDQAQAQSQAQALATAKARVLSKRKLRALQQSTPQDPHDDHNNDHDAHESSRPSKLPRTSEGFLVDRHRPEPATDSPKTDQGEKSEDGEIDDSSGSGSGSDFVALPPPEPEIPFPGSQGKSAKRRAAKAERAAAAAAKANHADPNKKTKKQRKQESRDKQEKQDNSEQQQQQQKKRKRRREKRVRGQGKEGSGEGIEMGRKAQGG